MKLATPLLLLLMMAVPTLAQRQMEKLGRGIVAIPQEDGKVFIGWRLLGDDPEEVAFNLYRSAGGAAPTKLNAEPITGATEFVDASADLSKANSYTIRSILDNAEQSPSAPFVLPANAPRRQYLSIPIQPPPPAQTPDGAEYTYSANDCSVGDVDGDGEYEIIVKWDPSNSKNSAFNGYTGNVFIDAYKMTGQRLWRINLGRNIRAGPTYTQFIVYDFDGDGYAEMACKTAPGTFDGTGKAVFLPGDNAAMLFRTQDGRILQGPEYLTVFNGRTGAAMATVAFQPARGTVSSWGDNYGQRVDQLEACAAYLDGVHPSLVTCRGYYKTGNAGRTVLAAWDWKDHKLIRRWMFTADPTQNQEYTGQGNHNLTVADVDNDGKDEIVYGACVIDDNGKGLYSTGWGHGDAMHVSDLDPSNPGLEVFSIQERFAGQGMNFRDAKTGKPLYLIPSTKKNETGPDANEGPGRGVCFNIDPRYPGSEAWARGAGMSGIYNASGKRISEKQPKSCNFAVWWDGDLLRELLDDNYISKWNWLTEDETTLLRADGCVSNNGTKSTPCLSADLFGDWREEVIWRTTDSSELRIYTTTIPTKHRLVTLMHNPQYRLAVAWQNVIYNQPPHPSFYLDEAAPLPKREAIRVVTPATLPAAITTNPIKGVR